ncbi:SMEK domain-containing protein [Pseudomonas stutzeri]|uniref:SMEK domain-containing protein n=1 Tax=Stutzerimonas stutzeri TaxID=316 RepID=UPI00210C157D|nr:SMEK domain-containing protein [Stutzerimonas stutzeri]MCQ4313707.1 SMEK domain-containing protein [Stutzerimonas stutzeri]
MDHQLLLNEVKKEFIELVMNVEASSAMSLFDTHRIAEKIMLPLFKIIMDWKDLRNLNAEDGENFPAIDLADDVARVAIQVTGTSGLEKVKRTLEKFLRHKLNDSYDRLVIYVLTKKQSTYSQKSVDRVVRKSMSFNAVDDILDYTDLLKEIAKLPPDKVTLALETLKSYRLGNDPAQHPEWLLQTEKSREQIQAFTPRWLFFAERKIPLIGREAELQALTKFMKDPASFRWWVICGPAGMGKTRLAHELELEYKDEWYCGFVDADEIKSAEQLLAVKRPTLIIVDYAARDAKSLNSLFKICCSLTTKTSTKLRLLLLEREANSKADWWNELVETSSVLKNRIRNHQYGEPLKLRSLKLQSEEILRAWIKEGAPEVLSELPKSQSEFWNRVKKVGQGRPLVIALVAAAFSRAPSMTYVPALPDLMRPILRKELSRWRSACIDEQSFTWLVQLLALAALIRGLPVLQPDHRIIVSRGDDERIFVIKDPDTQEVRIPTYEDLREHTVIFEHLANYQKALWNTLTLLVPGDQLNSTVKLALESCPPTALLQPDLLGEFFIDELWLPRLPFSTSAPLPPLSDTLLESLIGSAWSISPYRLIETLEALKKTTTSVDGYLRIITMLVGRVCAAHTQPERGISMLAGLLYNATITLGAEKSSAKQSQHAFALLSQLMEKFPKNQAVAYRHLKAHIPQNKSLRTEEEIIENARKLTEKAVELVGLIKSNPQDHFELHWADSFTVLSIAGIQKNCSELILTALASAQQLQENFNGSLEVMNLLAAQYKNIAQHLAELYGDNFALSDKIAPVAKRVLPVLQEHVVRILKNCSHDQALRVSVTWSLINIMFAYAKLESPETVLSLDLEVMRSIPKISDAKIAMAMKMKSTFNAQTAFLQKGEIERLFQSTTKLKVDFESNYSDEGAIAYMALLERVLQINFTKERGKLVENFNRLLYVYPYLSDVAPVIEQFSRAFAAARLGALFNPDECLPILTRLLPSPNNLESLCAVLYHANYLVIQAFLRRENEEFLVYFDRLVELVRKHPSFDQVVHCLDFVALQYWLHKGRPQSQRISNSCKLKIKGEGIILVRVEYDDGSVLSESTMTLSSFLPAEPTAS